MIRVADIDSFARRTLMARQPPSSLKTPDPVEMAQEMAGDDPAAASAARDLLVSQNRLVRMQMASERVGLILKLLTGAAGLAAAALLGVMAWSASRDHSVIIQPFRVPADMTAKGQDGPAVAGQVLDRVTRMQTALRSLRGHSAFATGSRIQTRIEIPTTGVSLNDLDEALRGWLGHRRLVDADIVRTPAGIAINLRATGALPVTIEGPEADLPRLLDQTAEAVMKMASPLGYADWLRSSGRPEEAVEVVRPLTAQGGPHERATAFLSLGYAIQTLDDRAAMAYLKTAVALWPDNYEAEEGAGDIALYGLQDEEASYQARLRVIGLHATGDDDPVRRRAYRALDRAYLGEEQGDFRAARAAIEPALQADLPTDLTQLVGAYAGFEDVYLHDGGAVDARLPQLLAMDGAAPGRRLTHLMAWRLTLEDDWAGALATNPVLANDPSQPKPGPSAKETSTYRRSLYWRAIEAHLEARTGHLDDAEAFVSATPLDCYICLLTRGRVAWLGGHGSEADQWFAKAAAFGPSLPRAYVYWGEALIDENRLDDAITRLNEGLARGPNWADTHELMGYALLRKGELKAAETRFKEAAGLAPQWGRNRILWGEAMMRQGRLSEAQAQWRIAAGLTLSPGDRARLAYLQRGGR